VSSSVERAFEARRLVIEAAAASKTSHIGSSMSIVDVLAVLYADVLPDGDHHFLLSKGHAAGALYATLVTAGVLGRDEFLQGYCGDGGVFPGHPERGLPGVEMTGGSLGHGPAIAVGVALAERDEGSGRRTYCVVGDGEMNEGSVWEAIGLAGHLRRGDLTLIVDANGFQALGRTHEVLDMGSLSAKLEAFGWEAVDVDGHDHEALRGQLLASGERPRALVAHTVKGKGIDFMEDQLMWHYRSLKEGEREAALAALEAGAA
jgi:transketolase